MTQKRIDTTIDAESGAVGDIIGVPRYGGSGGVGGARLAKGVQSKIPEKELLNNFTTSRGSTYEHYDTGTTVRNRSSKDHSDKTEGIQPESGKTIFLDKKSTSTVGGLLQNTDIATQLLPILGKDNKIIGTKVVLIKDYGPRKAGEILATAPAKTSPEKGLYPVEIWKSESPIGDSAKGIHFGNEIIDVVPNKSKLEKSKGGSIVERNPYQHYKKKAI
jgi:hypothetical protein